MILTIKRRRTRRKSPKHTLYLKLHEFRLDWEAKGGTRGTLRRARKVGCNLFP